MALKKAAVIGWPINHSLSPHLHSYWLKELAIDGVYEKISVSESELKGFFSSLRKGTHVGCNVTIPHKETVRQFVDQIDEVATTIGAINTVWMEAGILKATNTDGYGFTANMDDQAPRWRDGKTAIMFGAGGSARATLWALQSVGYSTIHIINRTQPKAELLCEQFGQGVFPAQWSEFSGLANMADLVVNTTSLSLNTSEPFPASLENLPQKAIVTDIVYTPLQTSLLCAAEKRGNKTVDGLGMLLHQAVPGFEKWFGARPQVSLGLRHHLLDQLGEKQS